MILLDTFAVCQHQDRSTVDWQHALAPSSDQRKQQEEDYKDTKNFEHECPVSRHRGIVFEQFPLCSSNVAATEDAFQL
jgi:hypothetical protein